MSLDMRTPCEGPPRFPLSRGSFRFGSQTLSVHRPTSFSCVTPAFGSLSVRCGHALRFPDRIWDFGAVPWFDAVTTVPSTCVLNERLWRLVSRCHFRLVLDRLSDEGIASEGLDKLGFGVQENEQGDLARFAAKQPGVVSENGK